MKLRPYQQKAIDLCKKAYSDGKRKLLIFMATGGGKSAIFLEMAKSSLAKNRRVVLVMRRKQLVFQADRLFTKHGIDASIVMADVKGFKPYYNLQICSIDTLARRDVEFLKDFDVVMVDEAHDSVSKTYQKFLRSFKEGTLFIGLTATPFLNNNKAHTFWDACVKPIEAHELRDMGFLVPCSLYIPHKINLDDIKIDSKSGDYQNGALGERMSKLEIVGNIVKDYIDIGKMKPAICFCVNKNHSIALCLEFVKAGIPAKHADESTPQKERDAIIKELQNGTIKVLCNVNIFSTGVDIPQAEVGILARPTRSETLYIQQVGRLLRPFRKCAKCSNGYDNSACCPTCGHATPTYIKKQAIIIDSGDNHSRHGHPFDVRYPVMNDTDKKREREKPITKTCKYCFYVYDAKLAKCPMCDGAMDLPKELYRTKEGKIIPYDEFAVVSDYYHALERSEVVMQWKPYAKYFKLYEKFGERAMKFKREFGIPGWIPRVVQKQKEEALKLDGKLYKSDNVNSVTTPS